MAIVFRALSPFNRELVGRWEQTDLELATQTATESFDLWQTTDWDPETRQALVNQLNSAKIDIVETYHRETGIPVDLAVEEFDSAVRIIWRANLGEKGSGELQSLYVPSPHPLFFLSDLLERVLANPRPTLIYFAEDSTLTLDKFFQPIAAYLNFLQCVRGHGDEGAENLYLDWFTKPRAVVVNENSDTLILSKQIVQHALPQSGQDLRSCMAVFADRTKLGSYLKDFKDAVFMHELSPLKSQKQKDLFLMQLPQANDERFQLLYQSKDAALMVCPRIYWCEDVTALLSIKPYVGPLVIFFPIESLEKIPKTYFFSTKQCDEALPTLLEAFGKTMAQK